MPLVYEYRHDLGYRFLVWQILEDIDDLEAISSSGTIEYENNASKSKHLKNSDQLSRLALKALLSRISLAYSVRGYVHRHPQYKLPRLILIPNSEDDSIDQLLYSIFSDAKPDTSTNFLELPLSISHTGGLVAIAYFESEQLLRSVSKHNIFDFPVGIDVEHITRVSKAHVERVMNSEERSHFNFQLSNPEFRTMFWAAKEALYKCLGNQELRYTEDYTIIPSGYSPTEFYGFVRKNKKQLLLKAQITISVFQDSVIAMAKQAMM